LASPRGARERKRMSQTLAMIVNSRDVSVTVDDPEMPLL
jgi:hypothetical protein